VRWVSDGIESIADGSAGGTEHARGIGVSAVVRGGVSRQRAIIRPPGGWPGWNLHEAWRYRSTCLVMARRSVKVRYRQTLIGATWAVLQPFLMMLVFTVFLGILAGIRSIGVPYPVMIYTGLVIWGAVSKTVAEGTVSILAEGGLIQQVYFPRIYCPVSSAIGSMVDLAFGMLSLGILLVVFGVMPSIGVVFAPVFIVIAYAAGLGVGMWLSALNTAYRDVGHMLPFLLQVWMFTSPIVYPSSIVPPEWFLLYSLNPMVAAIDGFRWAFAGAPPPDLASVIVGATVAAVLLVSGYVFFRYREPLFADQV
jgi:lipopolysaccharide transport system permease protein